VNYPQGRLGSSVESLSLAGVLRTLELPFIEFLETGGLCVGFLTGQDIAVVGEFLGQAEK